ncbi:MAG: hypothetical protein ABIZ70_09140 [Gemmatimonadales bacterium]
MRRILVAMASVVGVVALVAARPARPINRFSVTLERTSRGWKAQCDSGCSWTELSVSCPENCRTQIDADGVAGSVKEGKTESAFGMVISRTAKGWQAEGIVGTDWKKVRWTCAISCKVKLDGSGVEVGGVGLFGG